MKEVVVQAYCDLCPDDEDRVPATEEVTYGGRLLDVCERHAAQVNARLHTLEELFAQGVEVGVSKAPPRPRKGTRGRHDMDTNSEYMRTCPDCGYTCPTRSALGQHVKVNHEKTLNYYTWST